MIVPIDRDVTITDGSGCTIRLPLASGEVWVPNREPVTVTAPDGSTFYGTLKVFSCEWRATYSARPPRVPGDIVWDGADTIKWTMMKPRTPAEFHQLRRIRGLPPQKLILSRRGRR